MQQFQANYAGSVGSKSFDYRHHSSDHCHGEKSPVPEFQSQGSFVPLSSFSSSFFAASIIQALSRSSLRSHFVFLRDDRRAYNVKIAYHESVPMIRQRKSHMVRTENQACPIREGLEPDAESEQSWEGIEIKKKDSQACFVCRAHLSSSSKSLKAERLCLGVSGCQRVVIVPTFAFLLSSSSLPSPCVLYGEQPLHQSFIHTYAHTWKKERAKRERARKYATFSISAAGSRAARDSNPFTSNRHTR